MTNIDYAGSFISNNNESNEMN